MTICPDCGKELKPGAKFCNGCGAKMPVEAQDAASRKAPTRPQTAEAPPKDAAAEPAQRVNRSEEARRKVALQNKSGDTTPVLADTFRAVMTEGGTVDEVAAADLPRVEPSEPPRANFAAEVRSKYWNLFIAAVAVVAAGLALLAISAIRRPRLERPVQYSITRDSFYFSTTRKLCRFDTSGRSSWVKKESGSWMLRGMIFFDIAQNGDLWLANPFRGTVDLLEQSGKWLDQFGLGKLGREYRFAALGNGNIAISIRDENKVDVIDSSRKLVASAGGYGSGFADLRSPGGVAELPDGYLLVADSLNLRIQVLDREYKFVESWNFPYKAVIPGDNRTEKVAVNHPGHEISLGAKFFPDSLAVDAKRGIVYVSMLNPSGKRPGLIATLDFNGEMIALSEISTRSGQRVNPRSITVTPDGLLTIVDTDAFIAGEWDPESGFFVEAHYQEIAELVAGMKRSSVINSALRYCGSAFTLLGIAGLAGLMSLVGTRQRAAWLGQDADHRYTRRRAQSFSTEVVFHIPGPEDISPSRQWRGTLSDAITVAVVPFAIIVSFIIRLIMIRTSTPQLAIYVPAAVAALLVWSGFIVSFILTKKWSAEGLSEQKHLRHRDQLFRLLGPEISQSVSPKEKLVDALLCRMPSRRQGLLLLTEYRLVWIDAGGKGGLFAKSPLLRARPLRDFLGAELRSPFLQSYWTFDLQPIAGGPVRVLTPHYWGAAAFAARMDWLVNRLNALPKTAPQRTIRPLCPNCCQPVPPDSTSCQQCGVVFKKPALAGVLSVLMPGLGQLYNGQNIHALQYFGAAAALGLICAAHFSGFAFTDPLWLAPAAAQCLFFHALSVNRAVSDAKYLSARG